MTERFLEIKLDNHTYSISAHQRHGGKDLILFLHGLGCSKENYNYAWSFSKFNHKSLLSFDFIGFGNSEKPQGFSYTMEDQATICNELIRLYSDFNLHVVAHSMGGAVGLLLSDDTLARIKSFSNLEGNLMPEDCFTSRKVIGHSFLSFQKELLPRLRKRMADNPEMLFDLEKSSSIAYYKSCQSLVSWSDSGLLMEKFKHLNCPKAYFYGEKNSGIEPLRHLDDIPLIMVEESGHMMMLDNPEGLFLKLNNFISHSN